MEHIAECHTQDYAADTKCQQRELAFQPIHHGQAEQGTEDDWQQQQRDGVPATEADQQEHQHQQQSACNGGGEVVLDLGGVIISTGGGAVIADFHLWVLLGKLLYLRVQHLEHG